MTPERHDRRLTRIRASIAGRFAGARGSPLQSIGEGSRAVVVHLKPDAVSVAAELNREFGSLVEITVGFKAFPGGDRAGSPSPRTLEGRASLPGIGATCQVDEARLPGGGSGSGKAVIRNTGHSPVEGSGSAGAGCLCRPGTLVIAGSYSGAIAGVGRVFHISPGGSETLDFIVGTASLEPGADYVVQPGRYEVVVPVDLEVNGGPGPVRILARGCFIEVT